MDILMNVYVTLGTQDKEFTRILEYVERLIEENLLIDNIYIQKGKTNYTFKCKNMKKLIVFDFKSIKEIEKILKDVDLVISHAGVGSILDSLKKDKEIIVVPRKEKYKEHVNDHQIEIAEEFQKLGYIKVANTYEELKEIVLEILKIVDTKEESLIDKKGKKNKGEKRYISNTSNFIERLDDYISNI